MTLSGNQPKAEQHRQEHSSLLRTLTRTEWRRGETRKVDAVVVAAARPAAYVEASADLAESLGALHISMCSKQARLSDVANLVGCRPTLNWMAVDIPRGYDHPLLTCATSKCDDAKVDRLGDLSVKRNLGLILARRLCWRTVLFLDDDIVEIDPVVVRRAAAAMGPGASLVGLPVVDFPDNSVVCHANRLSGGEQGVFVGGSALLVDSTCHASFFPEIYNEDWLFLYDELAARKVAVGGAVHQRTYQPYDSAERAVAEEFGDVLAEGLVALLHEGRRMTEAAATDYWRQFLESRAGFIEGIATRLSDSTDVEDSEPALRSLAAAEERRAAITPDSLAAYVRTWRGDLPLWADRLADVVPAESAGKATADLGLQAETSLQADAHIHVPVSKPGVVISIEQNDVSSASSIRIAETARVNVPGRLLQQGFWDGIDGPHQFGEGCDIGHYCVVGQGVTLGARTILDTYCYVECGATIGEDTLLTHRASVGARAAVGANCVIGGFICERSEVGRGCRVFGALVHRQLDPSLPWDSPEAEESSPKLEDGAFVGWGATVIGGIVIGAGAYVCADATVAQNVPPGWIVTGLNEMRPPEWWSGELGKSPFFRRRRSSSLLLIKRLALANVFAALLHGRRAAQPRRVGGSPAAMASSAASASYAHSEVMSSAPGTTVGSSVGSVDELGGAVVDGVVEVGDGSGSPLATGSARAVST